jgi:DNA-binding NarL/FixJ family response regulator
MTVYGRQQALRDATGFLSGRGMRPRAIVVVGDSGSGKTTFLDQLQVEILAAGSADLVVVDDAQDLDAQAIDRLRARIESDARNLVIVAHDGSALELGSMIDRACDRRVVALAGLDDDSSRALLGDLGIQPWTYLAGQLIARCAGLPRALIDGSVDEVDVQGVLDASDAGSRWSERSSRRAELGYAGDPIALERYVDDLEQTAADESAAVDDRGDARAALAEVALISGDLERAVQLGELAGAADGAGDRVRIVGASNASVARAIRGEPTAMLSLHALAGRAARAQEPMVEAYVWFGIAYCACVLGDVATSERAAVRCIQLCDSEGSLLLGMRARIGLADILVATNRPGAACEYLEEIKVIAADRHLHRLRIGAMTREARAHLLVGHLEAACRLADESLELVLRSDLSRMDVVETAIIAARAYAAAGSVELALAPLDALVVDLGDSHSPDFWLVLEAVRALGKAGTDPAGFKKWLALMGEFDADGHGGALRAAHAEADAWRAAIEGRKAEAARLAERARQLWIEAECHDELPLTDPIMQQAPLEHGPRMSIVGGAAVPTADPEAFEALTKREREIARYVAGGLTNPEIAGELHLSPRTVEHHVASILRKLELPNRRALVRGRV